MRKQANPIELSPDDVDMVDDEDEVVEIVKPYVREKRKRGSKSKEVKSICSLNDVVISPTPGFSAPTPSPPSKTTLLPSPITCSLHSQHVPKSIVNSALPLGLVCSVLLEKTSISTMMESGANENPLMVKTFEFVKKVSY